MLAALLAEICTGKRRLRLMNQLPYLPVRPDSASPPSFQQSSFAAQQPSPAHHSCTVSSPEKRASSSDIMETNTNPDAPGLLGFSITFSPLRVRIAFCTPYHATRYLEWAKNQAVYQQNSLDGRREDEDPRVISMRLPSRVIRVDSTDAGCSLTFGDENLARKWVGGLGIWQFAMDSSGSVSKRKVRLNRDLTSRVLERALEAGDERTPSPRAMPPPTFRVPGAALTSASAATAGRNPSETPSSSKTTDSYLC